MERVVHQDAPDDALDDMLSRESFEPPLTQERPVSKKRLFPTPGPQDGPHTGVEPHAKRLSLGNDASFGSFESLDDAALLELQLLEQAALQRQASCGDQLVQPELAARASSSVETNQPPASAPSSDLSLDVSNFIPKGELCDHYRKAGIEKLHPWQAECLTTGNAMEGGSLVFTAPTSGGKTLVAEILLVRSYLHTGKKAIMVLPYVSIVTEKAKWLKKILEPNGYRVEGFYGIQGGDIDKVDLAICTIEKANALVNRMTSNGQMSNIGIVVVDEMHMLGDESRGYLLELLMTKVKYMGRTEEIQFVGMSATLPNIQNLADWIGATLYQTDYRPVPLVEYVKLGDKIYRHTGYGETELAASMPPAHWRDTEGVVALCLEIILEGNGTLVFCSSKKGCQSTAKMICQVLPEVLPPSFVLSSAIESERSVLLDGLRRTPGELDEILAETVPHGVAYHNAGMTVEERDLIETAFRKGVINVLTATSTLAAGVNLPAKRVIFRSPYIGNQFLDATRYRQMCGRAGRAGQDTQGQSFLILEAKDQRKAQSLLTEPLKECQSCLCADKIGLQRAVLEVVAAEVVSRPEEVEMWLKCTLFHHLNGSTSDGWNNVHKTCVDALNFLGKHRFIEWSQGLERYSPTPFGLATFCSSLPPKDAITVARDLAKARQCFILSSPLHLLYQVVPVTGNPDPPWCSYIHIFHNVTNENDKKVALQIGIAEGQLYAYSRNPPKWGQSDADPTLLKYKRFYAALMLNFLVNEMPVGKVADKFEVPRGSLQMLQDKAATFANMVSGFCQRLNWWDLEVLTGSYAKQLNYGCQTDVLPLCEIPGVQAARARALFKAGLRNVAAVATASQDTILKAITAKQAFKINRESGSHGANGEARDDMLRQSVHQYNVDINAARKISSGAKQLIRQQASELQSALAMLAPTSHNNSCHPQPAAAVRSPSPAESGRVDGVGALQHSDSGDSADAYKLDASAAVGASCSNGITAAQDDPTFGERVHQGLCTCVRIKTHADCDSLLAVAARQRAQRCRFSFSVVTGSRRSAALMENGRRAAATVVKSDAVVIHGICVCWSAEVSYYVDCIDNAEIQDSLLEFICQAECQKVSFGMKKALHAIDAVSTGGWAHIRGDLMDPQVAAWMLDPHADLCKGLEIKQLLKKYGCAPMAITLNRWVNACAESVASFTLMRRLDSLLEEQLLVQPFLEVQMKMLPIWVHIESVGIGFDKTVSRTYVTELTQVVAKLENLGQEQAGKKFDLSSPKQVGQILYQHLSLKPNPKTKAKEGKLPSTDSDNLDWMMKHSPHPVLHTIQTHRKVSKLASSFARPLQLLAEVNKTHQAFELGPRIHPCILHLAVPTGRIAMDENANLQCIPKFQTHEIYDTAGEGREYHTYKWAMRKLFVAAPGHVLLSADYSQVELRLIAHFSQDEALIQAFHSKEDVFRVMAALWMDKLAPDVTSEERGRAKSLCYGVLYGAGKVTLAKTMHMTEAEAEQSKWQFLRKFPRVKDYHRTVETEVKNRGFVETLLGRRRAFPDIASKNSNKQAAALRAAVNTICQGSAADMLNMATLAIFNKYCNAGRQAATTSATTAAALSSATASRCVGAVRIVNQVHDELILEVPEAKVATVAAFVRQAMEKSIGLSVPMKVEVKVGQNWEELADYPR